MLRIFQLGYEATKSLIEKIANPNEPVKRIIIPHRIVKRFSCDYYESSNGFHVIIIGNKKLTQAVTLHVIVWSRLFLWEVRLP